MLKHSQSKKDTDELASLEGQYRAMVKNIPTSFNATREHMKQLQKCVQDLKRVRRRMGHYNDDDNMGWLQEILDRPGLSL